MSMLITPGGEGCSLLALFTFLNTMSKDDENRLHVPSHFTCESTNIRKIVFGGGVKRASLL